MKTCTKCGQEKEDSEFGFHSTKKRFKSTCFKCDAAASREYKQRFSTIVLQKKKLYRETHPEKIRAYSQWYDAKNRGDRIEKDRLRRATYSSEMVAKTLEQHRTWCRNHPEETARVNLRKSLRGRYGFIAPDGFLDVWRLNYKIKLFLKGKQA